MNGVRLYTCAVVLLLCCSGLAASQATDPKAVWPLCGRITQSPLPGWQPTDGCPADRFGEPAYSDAPFSATFGPRPLSSESNRYDFHRGIDIATPIGTPFFAISDGVVMIAGVNSSYTDPLIKLRHYRPGATTCSGGGGCYHSYYLHISDWVVAAGENVRKGQLLGFTGASSASGFEHLHFEVRDAPAFDVYSAWSRDAIHPLGVLPYSVPNDTTVTFSDVNASDPDAVTARVVVTSNRYDLVTVEMAVFDDRGVEITQPGSVANANGYHVLPPFYDLESWNFEYSHKDSAAFPWEAFGRGGDYECPYASEHGPAYDANVHMDAQVPGNSFEGLFNGVHVTTGKYWLTGSRDYRLDLEFPALKGPAACIEASAVFASGDSAARTWGNCDASPPPATITISLSSNKKRNRVSVNWSGASSAKVDIYRDGSKLATTRNDGGWNDRNVSKGNSYHYQVCEKASLTLCSPTADITL